MAEEIEKGVKAAGDIEVRKFDLEDANHSLIASVAAEWYWADGVLLGSPTILGEALKPIWDLTTCLLYTSQRKHKMPLFSCPCYEIEVNKGLKYKAFRGRF